MHSAAKARGTIAWMVYHRVAPNLLMLLFLFGGLYMISKIKQEIYPEFEVNKITITINLPGSSPREVEASAITAIESAVSAINGISSVRSTIQEGQGTVYLDLEDNQNKFRIYQDVQQAVNNIRTLPDYAEKPTVKLIEPKVNVVDLQLYGNASYLDLSRFAERIKDQMLLSPQISQIQLDGIKKPEIHIDVSKESLRHYDLTLNDITQIVRDTSISQGAGSVKTQSGEILLRVNERRNWADDYESIPVVVDKNGVLVRLDDIAKISEDFDDAVNIATFNNLPSIGIEIYRVGSQTPASISQAVRTMLPEIQNDLPRGVRLVIQQDRSVMYLDRVHLLLKNGFVGLLLVLLILSLFLEFKVAFWVTVGIPTVFLGTLLFLPMFNTSINMISLFAFIIALGIIVDDAIVVAENVYEYRRQGKSFLSSAIQGTKDIAVPISFSIITNIVAFMPLMLTPGWFGKMWGSIPIVISIAFIISWVEAIFILPAHLAYARKKRGEQKNRLGQYLCKIQNFFSVKLNYFINTIYSPLLRVSICYRYITFSILITILIIVISIPVSGRLGFMLMPKVDSDYAQASVILPLGTSLNKSLKIRNILYDSLVKVIHENGGEKLSDGIFTLIKENTLEVRAYLKPEGQRPISTSKVIKLWREGTPFIPGVDLLRFAADARSPGSGANLVIKLSHSQSKVIENAAKYLATKLETIPGVYDIELGSQSGKPQLTFHPNEEAMSLGLTTAIIAEQLRASFYGIEILNQQRDNSEVTVKARLQESQRQYKSDIENFILITPEGGQVPLYQVTKLDQGKSNAEINRQNGNRTLLIKANVEPYNKMNKVIYTLNKSILPQLKHEYPNLNYSFGGNLESARSAINTFYYTVLIALLVIYAILAIAFRSYLHPVTVMMSIPFGIVGAIIGHCIMGYSLSLVSIMGMIALGGIVINNAIVLIDKANDNISNGICVTEAIYEACIRRFRPILLTAMTTFLGLAPMIFESSRQAKFMVPMAISLGYGIIFATAIIVFFIPCLYLIIHDLRKLVIKSVL